MIDLLEVQLTSLSIVFLQRTMAVSDGYMKQYCNDHINTHVQCYTISAHSLLKQEKLKKDYATVNYVNDIGTYALMYKKFKRTTL